MEVQNFIGKIKSWNKVRGYGHLTPNWAINDDDNIFFHCSRTVPQKCFIELGKEVLFQLEKDAKGRWMAVSILDTKYARPEVVNKARLAKRRPDFLPESFMLREDRELVKKEARQVDMAKKEQIMKNVDKSDVEEVLSNLVPTKEV